MATIRNKNPKSPLIIPEGIEMVTVITIDRSVDHLSLHKYQVARLIFYQIIECYCCKPALEETEISIYMEASDPYGQKSTRNYGDPVVPWSLTHQESTFLDITTLFNIYHWVAIR